MEYKDIPGYPGYYADRSGEIYSQRSGHMTRITSRVHKGYLHAFVKWGIGRKTKEKVPVHHLVLYAFCGAKPFEDAVCRHLNGNPLDNSADNLKWGTTKENVQDSIRHGTAAFMRHGEQALASRLNAEAVRSIEQRAKRGEMESSIAKEYGISQRHVSSIKMHKSWKHLWA